MSSEEDYYLEPDGFGVPTIWVANSEQPDLPVPVLSKDSVTEHFWPDVVARMTGTTITTDDATVERIAAAIYPALMLLDEQGEPADWATCDGAHRQEWLEAARAALAALTGVPHD